MRELSQQELEALKNQKENHGPLVGCSYWYNKRATGIIRTPGRPQIDEVCGWCKEVAETDQGLNLTVSKTHTVSDPFITVYRPKTDVLREIEAFALRENLPVLSRLECLYGQGTGARVSWMILLVFDDSALGGRARTERQIDVQALEDYGLKHLADELNNILHAAEKDAPILSQQGKPIQAFTGLGLAGFMSGGMQPPSAQQPPAPAPRAQATLAGSWVCPQCGKESSGKFCGNCGFARPTGQTWTCPLCGKQNTGKFCVQCFVAKPKNDGWTCPMCGKVNTEAFCMECGSPQPTAQQPPKPPADSWTCPACGKVTTGRFCVNCGAQKQ